MELPLVPSCDLDAAGLSAQRERYRQVGDGAVVLERTQRHLVVEVDAAAVDTATELVEVERECCPFFAIDWDPELRRLSIGVSEAEYEPALDAIAFALGLSAARV
jgi:hypothetical protein